MEAGNEKKNSQRIAVLSDIHGNLPALKACLRDARLLGADSVWCLGDCLEGGLFVNEIVDRLQSVAARILIGNGDQKILRFRDRHKKWEKTCHPSKFQVLEQAHKKLGLSQRAFLESLPTRISTEVQGVRVCLAHGSPFGVCDRINPDTSKASLRSLAKQCNAHLIVCGHTHRPLYRQVGKTLFMNPGSVGCPSGDTCRAAYAILHFIGGSVWMEPRQVGYTIPKAMRDAFRVIWSNHRGPDSPPIRIGTSRDAVITKILRFAGNLGFEESHAIQVGNLALNLFDFLTPLHAYGQEHRNLLECGAILHDIGVTQGSQEHHKTSMNMILSDRKLPFNPEQRLLIALIARYHRRALPAPGHAVFRGLAKDNKRLVAALGGILRMADGLDRSHRSCITGFRLVIGTQEIRLYLAPNGHCREEIQYGQIKSDLFQSAFKHTVRLIESQDPVDL